MFKTIKRPDGREYSATEVARWCAAWLQRKRGGGTFSTQYVLDLRYGKKTNPTKSHLEALAAFFRVDPAIFFDSEKSAAIRADLELAVAIRDVGVSAIALRAVNLEAAGREQALEFMRLSQAERQHVLTLMRSLQSNQNTQE